MSSFFPIVAEGFVCDGVIPFLCSCSVCVHLPPGRERESGAAVYVTCRGRAFFNLSTGCHDKVGSAQCRKKGDKKQLVAVIVLVKRSPAWPNPGTWRRLGFEVYWVRDYIMACDAMSTPPFPLHTALDGVEAMMNESSTLFIYLLVW